MINVVKIISTKIVSAKRLVKLLRYGLSDVQEVNQSQPYGVDSNPIPEMRAIYAQTGVKGENVIIGYINANQLADVGEIRLFSTDNKGVLKTFIHVKNNEEIHFGGSDGNLTRFQELESGYNQLKADHNDLVSKWNAFCSSYSPGSPATVGTPPTLTASTANVSTASISGAKLTKLKTM